MNKVFIGKVFTLGEFLVAKFLSSITEVIDGCWIRQNRNTITALQCIHDPGWIKSKEATLLQATQPTE